MGLLVRTLSPALKPSRRSGIVCERGPAKPRGAATLIQFMKPLAGRYDGEPVLGEDPALLDHPLGLGRGLYFTGDLGNSIQPKKSQGTRVSTPLLERAIAGMLFDKFETSDHRMRYEK